MSTLDGILTRSGSELLSDTFTPPTGAGCAILTVILAEVPPTTEAGFSLTLATLFFWRVPPTTTLPWFEAPAAKPPGLLGFEPDPQPANRSRLAANIKGSVCRLTVRKLCYLVS